MQTLTNHDPRDKSATGQAQNPMWMVLHGGSGEKRYRWSDWAAGVVEYLTGTGQWVAYPNGNQIEVKHRMHVTH